MRPHKLKQITPASGKPATNQGKYQSMRYNNRQQKRTTRLKERYSYTNCITNLVKLETQKESVATNYPKIDFTVVDKILEPLNKELHHFNMIHNQRDHQKPGVKPQFFKPNPSILRRAFEIPPVQYRLVENVRFEKKPSLARPQILVEIELADSRSDLPNFRSLEARFHQFGPILLLVPPQPHVSLENLVVEVPVLRPAPSVRMQRRVAHARELPLRVLHEEAECLRSIFLSRHSSRLNTTLIR